MHATHSSLTAARGGLAELVVAGVLWGTGGLTGTVLRRVSGAAPLTVAALRLAVGGVLLVAVLLSVGRRWPAGRAAWSRIGAFGALAALYQACYFAAVALTSVSLATLVTIGSAPVLVLVAEAVTGRRPIDLRGVGTIVLALAGLALLVGPPTGGSGLLAGVALALVSATGFATITLLGARPVPGLDALTTTGYGFLAGGAALLVLAATTTGIALHPGVATFGLLALLGTGPTAVAYGLFFRGLAFAGPRTASVLALVEPLTGTLLAVLLLGDRLRVTGVVGAALLGCAVLCAAQPVTRRPGDSSTRAW
jgi:DME family drug/metabolite transporter